MHLSKQLASCVAFARWCQEYGVDPGDAAELVALARRAFAAGEAAASRPGWAERERKAGEAFEEKAIALGFAADWPGLWPVLNRGGRDIHLPSIG